MATYTIEVTVTANRLPMWNADNSSVLRIAEAVLRVALPGRDDIYIDVYHDDVNGTYCVDFMHENSKTATIAGASASEVAHMSHVPVAVIESIARINATFPCNANHSFA